jgi:hypothetical protein
MFLSFSFEVNTAENCGQILLFFSFLRIITLLCEVRILLFDDQPSI